MRDDLLFHLTTKENWNEHKKSGNYEPESLESDGFIHCSSGSQVENTANRFFKGQDEILLLIIDASMIREDIKYEKDEETGEKFPHIYGPISVNAIIDKIVIRAEDDGQFNIGFTSE